MNIFSPVTNTFQQGFTTGQRIRHGAKAFFDMEAAYFFSAAPGSVMVVSSDICWSVTPNKTICPSTSTKTNTFFRTGDSEMK